MDGGECLSRRQDRFNGYRDTKIHMLKAYHTIKILFTVPWTDRVCVIQSTSVLLNYSMFDMP